MKRFRASSAAATELAEMNVYAVILAENEDGSGSCLEVQRALSFDEQDRALGQDTYCLHTETGATHYGGVTSWVVTQNHLEILLDAEAAAALDVRKGFSVAIKPEHVLMLQEGLSRVIGSRTASTH